MEKGIILYKSKYGATKKYIAWLKEETGFACVETAKADIKEVEKYDIILLCGGLYASGIAGLSFLNKNYERLKNKKLAIFCVGASPFDQKAFDEVRAHNLKKERKNIPLFYGRGAWDEQALSFKDRVLCNMLRKAIEKKEPSTYEPWMSALMSAAHQPCDWTDKTYLEPLLRYVNADNTP